MPTTTLQTSTRARAEGDDRTTDHDWKVWSPQSVVRSRAASEPPSCDRRHRDGEDQVPRASCVEGHPHGRKGRGQLTDLGVISESPAKGTLWCSRRASTRSNSSNNLARALGISDDDADLKDVPIEKYFQDDTARQKHFRGRVLLKNQLILQGHSLKIWSGTGDPCSDRRRVRRSRWMLDLEHLGLDNV